MGNAITERTISCIQILEVRVQCVVVDMHIDQLLQKKNNSMPNEAKSFRPIKLLQAYCKQSKGFGQRDKFIVPILIFGRTLICDMPFYVYPVHQGASQD